MGFDELPRDLKDIVSAFAYQCKWETVEKDMNMCDLVREMNLSPVFTRSEMWSGKYRAYIPCPFEKFEPIQNFTGSWADYIDWHAVHELLWRLDFRRKFVKLVNSREGWRASFKEDWRNIVNFDTFYCFLLYSRVPCFKPLWKPGGFTSLQSYRSPFVSARWWIED